MRPYTLAGCKRFIAGRMEHIRLLSWGALWLLFSAYIMFIILNYGVSKYGNRFLIDEYLTNQAWRPFAYRFLVPEITQIIMLIMPPSLHDALYLQLKNSPWFMHMLLISNQKPLFAVEVAIVFLLMWGALIGYMIMLHKLALALWPRYPGVGWIAPFIGAGAIVFSMYPLVHIYDLPLLFLWTGCMYFAFRQNWAAFLTMFALACMNKETALLLIVFLFATKPRLTWNDLLSIYLPVGVVYACIRYFTLVHYLPQPGTVSESYIQAMVQYFLVPWNINDFFRFIVMFFMVVYDWPQKPAFLKKGLVLVPVFLALWVAFGTVGEFRVLFEIYPTLVLLGTYTLVVSTGLYKSPIFGRN